MYQPEWRIHLTPPDNIVSSRSAKCNSTSYIIAHDSAFAKFYVYPQYSSDIRCSLGINFQPLAEADHLYRRCAGFGVREHAQIKVYVCAYVCACDIGLWHDVRACV